MTDTTAAPAAGAVILVPGYWLGAWAWDDVVGPLRAAGREVVALTLPGLEPDHPGRGAVTLDEQVQAVVTALRANPGATLVGHSGAGPVVQLAADAAPELVARLVWVDSGPLPPGPRGGPDAAVAELPLPSWEALEADDNSLEGLTEVHLARFREGAVPQPAGPAREEVLTRGDWAGVPATVVCSSITAAALREMVQGGHPWFAVLGQVRDLTYVDLPTGHWPMWSRPADLAAVLAGL